MSTSIKVTPAKFLQGGHEIVVNLDSIQCDQKFLVRVVQQIAMLTGAELIDVHVKGTGLVVSDLLQADAEKLDYVVVESRES